MAMKYSDTDMAEKVIFDLGDVILRLPTEEDVDDLLLVKNEQEAAMLLGRTHAMYTREDIQSWIAFHRGRTDERLYVVEDKESGHVVGHAGLYQINTISRRAEYGILLGNKRFRGRGLGQKITRFFIRHAFEDLGLHKVKSTVITDNQASYHMCLKSGFVQEGLMRDETYKNDQFYDVYLLSVLSTDYRPE